MDLLLGPSLSEAAQGKMIETSGTGTDDLRNSEASLAEAHLMTQQLIEALPNPIFFKNTDGRYLGVNKAWEKFAQEASEVLPNAPGLGENYLDALAEGRAFERGQSERCDGLLTFPEALSLFNRGTIAQFAARGRLPTAFGWKIYCQAGGLLSYGPNLGEFYARLGFYADRILQGAKPADLPVELPIIFEAVVNNATAKTLGLTIPPSILARADEVIE